MRRLLSVHTLTWVTVLLLLSLVPPLSSASAQPAPCPEEYPFDANVGACVDPETGQPVDPSTGLPLDPGGGEEPVEEEPVDELPEGDLASFTLFHLACNNDFNPDAVRDAGGIGPSNGCLTFGKPSFTYTVAANGVTITSATLDATERDYARLDVPSPVPAGTLTITVAPMADYATELVSCALSIDGGFTDIVEPSIGSGSATLNTEPDQDVECWVYNVNRTIVDESGGNDSGEDKGIVANPPEATGVPVSFYVLNCPAGTLPTDDLSAKCNTPAGGITFTVANETETLTTGTTESGGTVQFANIPTGTWGFIQTLPPSYGEPIVVCNGTFDNGSQEAQMEVLFGNQIRMLLFADGRGPEETFVDCTWLNIPASGADNGPQIFIQTRHCVVDLAMPANVSLAEAETLCPEEFPGKTFAVDVNGQALESDTSRENGQVFFTKLLAPNGGGIYGVSVALGNRERTLAVFCDNNFGADVFHTVTTTVSNGNRIDQEMYEGQTMRCSWFISALPRVNPNITPVPGASPDYDAIQIYNRECPPSVDLTAPSDTLCPQDVSGVTFDITRDGEALDTQTNSGSNGILLFQPGGIAAAYVFAPRPIEGYGDLRYSCEFALGSGVTEASSGTLNTASPGIPIAYIGSGNVVCMIYYQLGSRQQAEEGTDEGLTEGVVPGITVLSKLCPLDTAEIKVDIAEYCNYPGPNITFDVTIDGEPAGSQTTGEDGTLTIPIDGGAGTYLIGSQPKAGHLGPDANCAITHADGSVEDAGSYETGPEFAFDGTSEFVCTYYFLIVPDELKPEDAGVMEGLAAAPEEQPADSEEPTGDGNSLTIQFWTCPTGVDPAADQTQLLLECSADLEERSLTMTVDDGTVDKQVTGSLLWNYQDSTIMVGIGGELASSAWCSSIWTENGEDEAEFPDSVSMDGGALTLTASHTATTTYCDWFFFAA